MSYITIYDDTVYYSLLPNVCLRYANKLLVSWSSDPNKVSRVHWPTSYVIIYGVPYEIRTRVPNVKGWCPKPLDERDNMFIIHYILKFVNCWHPHLESNQG